MLNIIPSILSLGSQIFLRKQLQGACKNSRKIFVVNEGDVKDSSAVIQQYLSKHINVQEIGHFDVLREDDSPQNLLKAMVVVIMKIDDQINLRQSKLLENLENKCGDNLVVFSIRPNVISNSCDDDQFEIGCKRQILLSPEKINEEDVCRPLQDYFKRTTKERQRLVRLDGMAVLSVLCIIYGLYQSWSPSETITIGGINFQELIEMMQANFLPGLLESQATWAENLKSEWLDNQAILTKKLKTELLMHMVLMFYSLCFVFLIFIFLFLLPDNQEFRIVKFVIFWFLFYTFSFVFINMIKLWIVFSGS